MKSYRVFLTKSHEAAKRIAKSFSGEGHTDDIESVEHGKAVDDARIPVIYHGKSYFYTIVTMQENGENDAPEYELTIC